MLLKFSPYENENGYILFSENGVQVDTSIRCKETFSTHFLHRGDKLMRFVRKDSIPKSPEVAARQQRILRVFERKMNFKTLATCEFLERKIGGVRRKQKYLLYTVSNEWKKSIPLIHILALLTRNYYPEDRGFSWKAVAEFYEECRATKRIFSTIETIVNEKGNINLGIMGGVGMVGPYGISFYHNRLMRHQRQAARQA